MLNLITLQKSLTLCRSYKFIIELEYIWQGTYEEKGIFGLSFERFKGMALKLAQFFCWLPLLCVYVLVRVRVYVNKTVCVCSYSETETILSLRNWNFLTECSNMWDLLPPVDKVKEKNTLVFYKWWNDNI